MTNSRSATLFTVFGFLLASLTGPLRAAPDQTLGMALMAASVDDDGTLVRGAGVTGVTREEEGNYRVTFKRNLADCTCTASVGQGTGVGIGGPYLAVANCPVGSDDDQISVNTQNAHLNEYSDRPFHLIVFCPR